MELKNKKPPGKKMIKRMSLSTKSIFCLVVGLVLLSIGFILLVQAGNLWHDNAPTTRWVLLGIYSLILTNGGLYLFGQSVFFKMQKTNKKLIKKALKARDEKKQKLTITKLDKPKEGPQSITV